MNETSDTNPRRLAIPLVTEASVGKVDAVINSPNIGKDRLRFDIYTYKNLRTVTPEHDKWFLLDAVNDFTSTLDNDEWDNLCKMFASVKRNCVAINSSDTIISGLNQIGSRIARTFDRLDLVKRAVAFAHSNEKIIFTKIKNQGKRIQDRPELTWGEDEYRTLTGLSIVSKILFPVFGEIIHRLSMLPDNTNEGKEVYAASVITDVFKAATPEVYYKLLFYIANDVKKVIDKDDIAAMYGITQNAINNRCVAIILIKNMVNFDLYDVKSIMTYINVSVQKAAKTNYNKKTGIHYSDWNSLKTANTEERSDSIVDETVGIFTDKVEKRFIINHAADRAVVKFTRVNNFREDLLKSAYDYYHIGDNIPPMTIFNELIIGVFAGPELGSAYSLRYLNYDKVSRLIAVIQLYMIRTGYDALVPMMSVIETDINRPIEVVTNSIMIDRGQSSAYSYVKAMIDHLNNFVKIQPYLDKFAHYIVATEFRYNVPHDITALCINVNTSEDGYWRFDRDILALMFEFIYKLVVDDSRVIEKESGDGSVLQERSLLRARQKTVQNS